MCYLDDGRGGSARYHRQGYARAVTENEDFGDDVNWVEEWVDYDYNGSRVRSAYCGHKSWKRSWTGWVGGRTGGDCHIAADAEGMRSLSYYDFHNYGFCTTTTHVHYDPIIATGYGTGQITLGGFVERSGGCYWWLR